MQFSSISHNHYMTRSNSLNLEELLKQNLSQFGLNPTNWTINFHQQNYALITNTDEDDFQFIGKLNADKTNWEYIKLFNL